MNININNLETIKVSPSIALIDERMRYNELREKKIARATEGELAKLRKDKQTPLEKAAIALLHTTLEKLYRNGAQFYVVPKDSTEAKRYDGTNEVGYATVISFVKDGMPKKDDEKIKRIEDAINDLLEGGMLDVQVGFSFRFVELKAPF